MKSIPERTVESIGSMFSDFIKLVLYDDVWLMQDYKCRHDDIIVIKKINDLVEIGKEIDLDFWKIVNSTFGKERLDQIKAIHKRCRIDENKRDKR